MEQFYEKRSKSRLHYRAPITIEDSAACFLYNAWLENLSGRGLYFETDLLLPPGLKVRIGIHDSSDMFFSEDNDRFIVEIIWRTRLIEDMFNYGYGAKVLFYDEMKELRKSPRKTVSKLIYFSSHNKYYQGATRNISRSGAFVISGAKISKGDELTFVVLGTKKYVCLKGEIVHSNLMGFGVKFKSLLKVENLPVAKYTANA